MIEQVIFDKPTVVTYGKGGVVSSFEPRELFPDYFSRPTHQLRHAYVVATLKKLVAEDDLCVTELLAPGGEIRDAVGRALTGTVIDDDTRRRISYGIDAEDIEWLQVLQHPVKIRCSGLSFTPSADKIGEAPVLPADTVRFKKGVVDDPTERLQAGGDRKLGWSRTGDRGQWSYTAPKRVDEWVDYGVPEVIVPLTMAWVCLGQLGRECRSAKSDRLRARYWKFEEVHPALPWFEEKKHPKLEPEVEPRKVGRPRKEK